MKDSFTFPNQAELFVHAKLENDEAYQWSVAAEDVRNMQMVLRSYEQDYDFDSAVNQINFAKTL